MRSTINIKNIIDFIQTIYNIIKKILLKEAEKLINFSNRNSWKKYCELVLANKEVVSINTTQLYIKININWKIKNTIIDSNIIRNFIIKKYIENKKYSI